MRIQARNHAVLLRAVALWAGLCFPLALPSMAQAIAPDPGESITIEDKRILAGIWRFPPHARQWSENRTWFDLSQTSYCRIGQAEPDFTFRCFDHTQSVGNATLDADGFVRLAASACTHETCMGIGRWLFRGQLQSKTEISGHIGLRLVPPGRYHEKPVAITITKAVLSDTVPDQGGQAVFLARLLSAMAAGSVVNQYDPKSRWVQPASPDITPLPEGKAETAYQFLQPEILRALGQVQAVIYVDAYHATVGFDRKGFHAYSDQSASIYDVEFEHGERLCGLHRRADGILDFFRCI